MPFRLPLTAERVYLRAGPHTQTFVLPGQVRPARPWDRLAQFGFLAFWPKAVGWLKLSGTADAGAGSTPVPLQDTAAGLDAVCRAHETPRDQIAPPKLLEANAFLVGSLPQTNRVFLRVEIDTDHDEFRRAVRERRNAEKRELVQPVRVLFFDTKQFGNYVGQEGLFDLVLKPCTPVPKFDGAVAIDLGNTGTTAAALSESDPVYKSASVKLVRLDGGGELGGEPKPLPSVVRLDRITSAGEVPEGMRRFPELPGDDRPAAVAFVAGELAAAGGADGDLPPGVVFGAKSLLNAKPPPAADDPTPDPTPREPSVSHVVLHARPGVAPQPENVEILSRVPGELLFTHAVRQFRLAASSWPADLVLTYPTTYGPRELLALTRAAARGWLRAMGQPQDFTTACEPNEDAQLEELGAAVRDWLQNPSGPHCRLVGLTLDEATSAAFFHIYRRVFEQPGGLVRFRYLYPAGLRLLLIDCGGGTTDVALVHALSRPPTPPLLELLEVDVLARTGQRGFGGDHITRAVCRIVKAKLQCVAARSRATAAVPPPLPAAGPTTPGEAHKLVTAFLEKAARLDPADELVPTKYDPNQTDPATLRRRTCFQGLWRLAEAVKHDLARGRPVKLRELDPALTGKDTSPLVADLVRPFPPPAQAQMLAQVGDVAVAPWEVDASVRRPIEAVMTKCNRLIRKHLTDAPGGEHEVDWVVVSGNGSRYPLVERLAREMLHVAGIEDRLTADRDNLKTAVAKGAVMARMVERVPRTLGIKFNRHLSELLPFDVGYHDLITNEPVLLFEEYQPLADLAKTPKRVTLVPPGTPGEGLGNTFVLERRFPGDDGYEQYAAYRFPGGIKGKRKFEGLSSMHSTRLN